MRDNECFRGIKLDMHAFRGSFVTLKCYEFYRFIPILFANIFCAFPCYSVDIDATTYFG